MRDAIKAGEKTPTPKGSRSYSTMTTQPSANSGVDMGLVDLTAANNLPETPGLKFEMPTLPLPKGGHVQRRYDPVVEQVTNLLMRHGKKSVAQRVRPFLRVLELRLTLYCRTWH
jgi:small subunit ribosomal protein S7